MAVSEMLEKMQENNLFGKFSEFPYVVHILAVKPATSCSAERSISALQCRLKLTFAAPDGATTWSVRPSKIKVSSRYRRFCMKYESKVYPVHCSSNLSLQFLCSLV